jgi:hypothetical protein
VSLGDKSEQIAGYVELPGCCGRLDLEGVLVEAIDIR